MTVFTVTHKTTGRQISLSADDGAIEVCVDGLDGAEWILLDYDEAREVRDWITKELGRRR